MNISEYMNELEEFRAQHGDLELRCYFFDGSSKLVRSPKLSHLRINNSRQSKIQAFSEHVDKPEQRGEAFCEV